MMAKSLWCCVFLPVTVLAALCSDPGIPFKFVCIGDSVQIFQNITSAIYKVEITLYKTFAGKEEAIAVWSMNNISNEDKIHDRYKRKVSLENETILIRDFLPSDEGTYVILYDYSTTKKEMQLCALTPPTMRCKPKVIEDGNILTVSLHDYDHCGKPVLSVHWMEYPNITYIDEEIIELPPGIEAGTYKACIDGEALKCVKNSTGPINCVDYTTKSMRGNNDQATSSDIPHTKTNGLTTVVIVSIVLFIVTLVFFGVILILIIMRRQFGILSKLKTVMRNGILLEEESFAGSEQRNEETYHDTEL